MCPPLLNIVWRPVVARDGYRTSTTLPVADLPLTVTRTK